MSDTGLEVGEREEYKASSLDSKNAQAMKAGTPQRQTEMYCSRVTFVRKSFHFSEAEHSPASWRMQQSLRGVKVTQCHTEGCPTAEHRLATSPHQLMGMGGTVLRVL